MRGRGDGTSQCNKERVPAGALAADAVQETVVDTFPQPTIWELTLARQSAGAAPPAAARCRNTYAAQDALATRLSVEREARYRQRRSCCSSAAASKLAPAGGMGRRREMYKARNLKYNLKQQQSRLSLHHPAAV